MSKMNANIMILDGGMGHELKLRGISNGTFLSGVLANENNCAANSNSDDASVVESITWTTWLQDVMLSRQIALLL